MSLSADNPTKLFSRFQVEILAVALAAYFTLVLNSSLWDLLLRTQSGASPMERWTFVLSIGLGVLALQGAIVSILLWGRAAKVVGVLLAVVAAITHYYNAQFATFFDTSMIRNVLATNVKEASELLTLHFFGSVALYSIAPIVLIVFYPVQKRPIYQWIVPKVIMVVLLLAITVGAIAANFKAFSAAMRNNRELRHLILPTSPLVSFVRVMGATTAQSRSVKQTLDPNASRIAPAESQRPLLTVVVLGETVRSQNWGLSGYERPTTPRLATLNRSELFNFPYAVACGTSTEVSAPCMFSDRGRERYDEQEIRGTESVLGLLHRLGVDMTWIDNQSGCKGVCDGIPSFEARSFKKPAAAAQEGDDFDENLLIGFEKTVSSQAKDQVIVLHMLGNHGPAYSKRYPKKFETFTPVCTDNNLGNCEREMIVNAYDNAIVYTDFIVSHLIEKLARLKDRHVNLIYVSDHGESLGEKGLYLHGVPYRIAPKEQLHVPFVFWIPKETQRSLKLDTNCLTNKSKQTGAHDLLPHTLLGLYKVNSTVYQKKWDFFKECRG